MLWYSPKTFLPQTNSLDVVFFMLNLNAGGLNEFLLQHSSVIRISNNCSTSFTDSNPFIIIEC